MPDAGAAVRTHAQCLARRSQFWRLKRWIGGCGRRGPGADRGRHRWRRFDTHSRRVQRRRGIQAGARRGATGVRAGRVRQHILHHADDAHGAGYRTDAGCHGWTRSARSADHRATESRFRCRRAWRRSDGAAHRVARAARQQRGGERCADKLRGCTGHIHRAWCSGSRTDGTVPETQRQFGSSTTVLTAWRSSAII